MEQDKPSKFKPTHLLAGERVMFRKASKIISGSSIIMYSNGHTSIVPNNKLKLLCNEPPELSTWEELAKTLEKASNGRIKEGWNPLKRAI